MTVEANIADSHIDEYLSEIDRYMADYGGGYPIIHALIGYFQSELKDHKREEKK